jgi:uncharacterized repeat protein (TIGR03803 family)
MTPGGLLTTLCSFAGTNGEFPYAGLIQCSDGNFYGTTYYGGSGSAGTVFEVTPTGTLTSLYSFDGTNGGFIYGGLIQGNDGNLYGTANIGGSGSDGIVFKVTPPFVTVTVGNFFSYQITATNSPTSYGVGGLPAGVTINTATGLISGTPTVLGTFTVPLTASNAGGTGNGTLTILVQPATTPTDTPTMPLWGLAVLAALLMMTAGKCLPRLSTVSASAPTPPRDSQP